MTTTQKSVSILSILVVLAMVIWAAAQPSSRWRVVAAYRTGLAGRTDSQAHNVGLALMEIDGTILQPGAEFSFNRIVGSWTADRGYVKAPVSYDGELIPAWGGGVCQASSTLYNVALLAGLDVIERHRHRFPAHYVPPGQDAAVAQFNIDLKLRNPYDFPLKIEARIEGDWVACRILAQRPLGREIEVEREIRQLVAPGEVIRAGGSGGGSRRRVVNHGQPGLRVAVYRRVTISGKSARTLISEDSYPPMNRLVEEGE